MQEYPSLLNTNLVSYNAYNAKLFNKFREVAMQDFGMSITWLGACNIIVRIIEILHIRFNIYVLKMSPMDESGMGEGYKKTRPWYPLYNIILFYIFGWRYMRGLSAPNLQEALITGAIWAGVCIVLDIFGWMIFKNPCSLSFKEFYIAYQPWTTLTYLAIFAGPVIGYFFV